MSKIEEGYRYRPERKKERKGFHSRRKYLRYVSYLSTQLKHTHEEKKRIRVCLIPARQVSPLFNKITNWSYMIRTYIYTSPFPIHKWQVIMKKRSRCRMNSMLNKGLFLPAYLCTSKVHYVERLLVLLAIFGK